MEEGCPSPTTRMWYLSGIPPINTVKCDGCYTWLSRMHCCCKWTYGSFRWINPLHYKCLPEMYPWEPSRASQVITICTARIEMNLNLYCWLCTVVANVWLKLLWLRDCSTEVPRDTDLGVEGAPWVAEVLSITQDEARQDLLFLNALQPQLQVLTWPSIVCLHIIWQEAQHLHHMLHEERRQVEKQNLHILNSWCFRLNINIQC